MHAHDSTHETRNNVLINRIWVYMCPLPSSASCLWSTHLRRAQRLFRFCPWELPLRLPVRRSPVLLPLCSLSGSSLREEQTSRWFPAGIHFLCHSYFYCTVITLNHSPWSLETYSALRPRDCLQTLPVQTKRHISCNDSCLLCEICMN